MRWKTERLYQIEADIQDIQKFDAPLHDYRIKVVQPGGSAGKASQQKGYPRLIHKSGKSKAIAREHVGHFQDRINAARKIKQLQREITKLEAF
jgi:hypothetical protein